VNSKELQLSAHSLLLTAYGFSDLGAWWMNNYQIVAYQVLVYNIPMDDLSEGDVAWLIKLRQKSL